MKKVLVLTLLIIGMSLFVFADGFLYPTADVLQGGQIDFSLRTLHLGIGAGVGGNFEFGSALSFYDLGMYFKVRPLKNTVIGISYLPFNFCFLDSCEFAHIFNIYGVHKFGNQDFNVNTGVKLMMAAGSNVIDGFAVLQKKVHSAFFVMEGGVEKPSSSQNVNFNFSTGVYERFGWFIVKGGLVWGMNLTQESLMNPIPYIGIDLILDLKR